MDDDNSINDVMKNGISVGFIGCGTIASSIATGLVLAHNKENDRVTKIKSMIISKRSESKSNELKEKFDNDNSSFSFDITENNQEIVNQADIIFLTVLPTQAKDVLNSLKFDPKRHILISLVSTTNLEQLANYSKLNLSNVSKMICLPSIARHEGIALLCCGGNDSTSNDDTGDKKISNKVLLKSIFNSMGGCVVLDTEYDLEACMVTTCTMGPLYGTMKKQRDWLLDNTNGLTKTDATNLVLKQFQDNDSADTEDNTDIDMLEHLINEQTPGGLNEQALKNYSILGGLHNIQQKVMDLIVNRIRGISNGEIK
ncbi:hypothetical protein FRACYDRAFT_191917 [Fragilariopsis cylindrus CCMP1102]|uniref:Pyrroline-5-carboxylate reductase catalytic N-terminal domain-containing protein n=1 Tax=Fragilariopsis cylindrus CCMP1102 TaxID=635003 RepID=A0A1E7F0Y6_9STRA|nr:hypothetical protein FRACYDRAFT_191917 [Fragilariopsis cylindrus CCMP1102]|eukprot:OEU11861.1 hypothetical protein FRACYDRAFT_191917 [Fragilariopsis cylindrus CCMP1102]